MKRQRRVVAERFLGREHETKKQACPGCGHRMELASGYCHDRAPKAGDVGVCIQCAEPHIFRADGTGGLDRVVPTVAERARIDMDDRILVIRAAIRATWERQPS